MTPRLQSISGSRDSAGSRNSWSCHSPNCGRTADANSRNGRSAVRSRTGGHGNTERTDRYAADGDTCGSGDTVCNGGISGGASTGAFHASACGGHGHGDRVVLCVHGACALQSDPAGRACRFAVRVLWLVLVRGPRLRPSLRPLRRRSGRPRKRERQIDSSTSSVPLFWIVLHSVGDGLRGGATPGIQPYDCRTSGFSSAAQG